MIYILIESILNLSHCLQNGMLSIGVWKQKLYNEKVYTNEQRKRTNDWQKKNEHCTYTETKKKCDARHHILWAVRSTGAKLTRCAKNISFALMRPITFTIHHIHIISTDFFLSFSFLIDISLMDDFCTAFDITLFNYLFSIFRTRNIHSAYF